MAEVLGIASSVAGLISLADVVVTKGYKFIKDTKDAEETVRKIVHEVNMVYGVLHSLRSVAFSLEEERGGTDPSLQIYWIEESFQTLESVRKALDKTTPSIPVSKLEKFKWPLKKSESKELLVEVQRHKATLTLAISATEM